MDLIDSGDTQPSASHRSTVLDALKRAERKVFTQPALKSAKAQVKFLRTRAKRSTKALGERLGLSRRTADRYRAGQLTNPQKLLRAMLVEETESAWQPQVRAPVCERASASGEMMAEVTAYVGFTCPSSSNDGHMPLSPPRSRTPTRGRSWRYGSPERRRKTCLPSSRRPSSSRISRNGIPGPLTCARFSRASGPYNAGSGTTELGICYKPYSVGRHRSALAAARLESAP
ncbi:telomere-protecting terminal protein Tpg [Streptomyces chartreusis]|uniref:telomere-protecting terminal protein Tpg n=1 Tax=Streptomyces chartreusis TaxID=1969 RepID=UPI003F4E41FE